jgi:hypothetical protein
VAPLAAGHTGVSGRDPYDFAMRLIGVPDASGKPTIWINADHVVSVQPIMRTGERTITIEAELKVDGLPLLRINLGEHPDRTTADHAFQTFLATLQSDPEG